eukprot:g81909.t1
MPNVWRFKKFRTSTTSNFGMEASTLNRPRKMASPWTKMEDQMMINYVPVLLEDANYKDKLRRNRFKVGFWEKVSSIRSRSWTFASIGSPGTLYDGERTAKQCRERWNRCLDPRFRRPTAYPFSAQEDRYIMQECNTLRPRWVEIGEPISRSGAMVKNRFDVLRNRMFYLGITDLHAAPVNLGRARPAARLLQQPQLRTADSGSRRTVAARGPSWNQSKLFPAEALAHDGKFEGKLASDVKSEASTTFPAERKVALVCLVLSTESGEWEEKEAAQMKGLQNVRQANLNKSHAQLVLGLLMIARIIPNKICLPMSTGR